MGLERTRMMRQCVGEAEPEARRTLHWFSRHDLLPAQRRALNGLFPDLTIVQDKRIFVDAQDIVARVRPGDEVVLVAPLSLVQKLLDLGLRPLWAEMEPTTADYAKSHVNECVPAPRGRWFKFVKFRRLVGIEMKFEDL